MNTFLTENFMLTNITGRKIYNKYIKELPIIDYHCHINPKEIYEDLSYDNITQVWLYGDHYKWRLMRACGIEEKYITGDASDYDKFCKYALALESAIGNPLYHWSHMELKKYFDYTGVLSSDTADIVWNLCNEKLRNDNLSVREIIKRSDVEVICTTDDPADDLIWHRKLKEDGFSVKVLPTWRPDKLMNIDKVGFTDYFAKLGEVSGVNIEDITALKQVIDDRFAFFHNNGCRISDHGLDYIPFVQCTEEEADAILKKGLQGEEVTLEEAEKYKTFLLLYLAKLYKEKDWVMQLHYGCNRNNNRRMFAKLGPDTGYDSIAGPSDGTRMVKLFDELDSEENLPKTIVYSLNETENGMIDTIIGSFENSDCPGKIQHGSAWWFNDNADGMRQQMKSLANHGAIGQFVGMLTDSRSFLSYTRHDYFRRILCTLIGEWVESGECPNDEKLISKIAANISYFNAKRYFGF